MAPSRHTVVVQNNSDEKIEITLSEEQYQHIRAEVSYAGRLNLEEETFGGYELCLQVSIPNSFGSTLEMKILNTTKLGEVEWTFSSQ